MKTHRIGYTLWPANFDLIEPGRYLDEAQMLGVDMVEIPFFATRLIADNRPLEPALKLFEAAMEGRSIGYTPKANIKVKAGPHRIELRMESISKTRTYTVNVKPGQRVKVRGSPP